MTEKDESIKLKTGTNYYGWLRQLNNLLDEKDLLTDKGTLVSKSSDPTIKKKQRIHIHYLTKNWELKSCLMALKR